MIEVEPIAPANSKTKRKSTLDMAMKNENTTMQTVTAENKINPAESGGGAGTTTLPGGSSSVSDSREEQI